MLPRTHGTDIWQIADVGGKTTWLLIIFGYVQLISNLFQTSSDDGEMKRYSLSDGQAHSNVLWLDVVYSPVKIMFHALRVLFVLAEPRVNVNRVM